MSSTGPTKTGKAGNSLGGDGAEGTGARDGGIDGGVGAARDEKIARGAGAVENFRPSASLSHQ